MDSDLHRYQQLEVGSVDGGYIVTCPLPDGITVGLGAEISSPFASYATEGLASKFLALTAGASSKIGILTKKLYMGPDQPDIQFEMKFVAKRNASTEVMLPVYRLFLMTAGSEGGADDVIDVLKRFERTEMIGEELAMRVAGNNTASNASQLIRYLRSPDQVVVRFGNILKIKPAYISNLSVSFSNVLDARFLPMEATATVTITPQDPLLKHTVAESFGRKL